ncbi:MAG: RHS repeat-associated core domain-containing protein, partial [Cruoricaptor ignavus]|nr:RHS repeat-associated core domain-containing protein [Cruoricaptor ignavus]
GFAPLGGQGDRRYTYDGNGNPTGYEEFKSFRMMVWDEENRLRGINDNGLLHLYTYDHTGERTLKSSSETSQTMINGATAAIITHNEDYTAYVSPYFVVQKGRFTKHYFEGASRISSKLGEGTFTQNGKGITAGGIDYLKQTGLLDEALRNYIKDLNTPPGPPTQQGIYASPEWTGQPYPSIDWEAITQNQEPPEGWPRPPKFNEPGDVPGPPVQFGDPITPETVEAGFNYIDNGVPERNIYFYHPDHLGSSSHITDINGDLSQHTEFMAFGEILFDEHSTSIIQPYLFNGKELDSETGLYYYGERYYDPKVSIFINVDPLVEKTLQSYQYANNNPIMFIDPTGMEAEDIIIGKSLTDNFMTNQAFNTFAKTKEGIAFLSDYEKKGNVIAGHTYMEDGKYHKQGIDLVFEGKDIGGSTRGYTEASMNGDRANIIFTINTNSKVGSQDGNTSDMGVLGQPYSQAGTDIAVKGILSRTI